nr:TOBE domain-containing protein [Salipiger aestuarii]
MGSRETAPRRLPPPSPAEVAVARAREVPARPADSAPAIKPGGILVDWADGQPPIIAANGDTAVAGEKVTFSIRPEKVTIDAEQPDRPNAYKGKVIDIAYLGNISTFHVELANGTMVKAQMVNARRLANRHITWEDEVWIGFSETAGVVLKD